MGYGHLGFGERLNLLLVSRSYAMNHRLAGRHPGADPSQLAGQYLGPFAARALGDPAMRRAYEEALARGCDELDSVLFATHAAATRDQAVAGEFLAYFAGLLFERKGVRPDLRGRRHFDQEDLLQSVIGDVFPRLDQLEFRSRGEFLALLTMRFGWKRQDKLRQPQGRTLDTTDLDSAEILYDPRWAREPFTPLTEMAHEEEEARLVLALRQLDADQQSLIRMTIEGRSREAMAQELDVSAEALRKRIERARTALRFEMERMEALH